MASEHKTTFIVILFGWEEAFTETKVYQSFDTYRNDDIPYDPKEKQNAAKFSFSALVKGYTLSIGIDPPVLIIRTGKTR